MSKDERTTLNALLKYVAENILHYGSEKKIPPLLRKKINALALDDDKNFIYTYKMILYSFMINKSKIEYAFSTKTFTDEKHKINYMMVIVSNSMNDIKNKVLLNEKAKQVSENDTTNAQYLAENNVLYGSDKYVRKTEELRSEKIEELW